MALVTGANHGIGAATALALAERGADVLVNYLITGPAIASDDYQRQRAQDATQVRRDIEALGRRCLMVEADLRDLDAPELLFDAAEEHLGPVSVLVHNASGWSKDSFAPGATDVAGRDNNPLTPATVQRQWEVDGRAGALLMAQFVERHRARDADWGRIVTLTSGTGGAFPGEVSYGAAKASLISYTLSAAAEVAEVIAWLCADAGRLVTGNVIRLR